MWIREEIEGSTRHTWRPSITWQPVTIATRKQVCTVSFHSGQSCHLKHFVYVWCSRQTPWPCACQASATAELQPHLNCFSRSTPAVLSTLLCNLCPERFHLVKSNFCPHGNKAFCVIFSQMLLTSFLLPIPVYLSTLGPATWESHRELLSV